MEAAPEPRRQPVWALAVLPLLLILPTPLSIGLLASAFILQAAVRTLRHAREQAAERVAPGAGAILLGRDRAGRPVVLEDRQLSAHALILGASGAGKSTTLLSVLGNHIQRGSPVVAIDMKGSPAFEAGLAAAAAASGRRLRVWSLDGSEPWNPLRHGNATELKDKLISTERFTEPHYQRAAERYTQLALQVLMETRPERPPTLRDVVALLDPVRLGRLTASLPAARAAQVTEYLSTLSTDQQSAVRGLGTRLAIISESHTGGFLEDRDAQGIDLRRSLNGGDVVLFSLNSSIYGKLSAQLGTLAIQDLVAATGRRLHEATVGSRPQALVGIDEFSALGSDNLISLLARGRESGVSVLLATQELADLDRAGRGFRDQVLGVTAVKVFHRQDVPASAELAAKMAGTERVWEHTLRVGQSPLLRSGMSRGTKREVERFVVSPNEIRSLRTGQAMLITKMPSAQVRMLQVDAGNVEVPRSAGGEPQASHAKRPAVTGAARERQPSTARRAARDRDRDHGRHAAPATHPRGGAELG